MREFHLQIFPFDLDWPTSSQHTRDREKRKYEIGRKTKRPKNGQKQKGRKMAERHA